MAGKTTLIQKLLKTVYRNQNVVLIENEFGEIGIDGGFVKEAGLICSGVSPNGKLVEIVEYKKHPFFIGVQFHPELKSRPNRPAPVFVRTNKSSKRKIKIVLKI